MSRPRTIVRLVRSHLRDRRIDTLTLHTTEGANRPGVTDLEGLAAFFKRVLADATWGVDAEGNKCRMLTDADAAWTNGFHDENHRSVTIEQVGFAATTKRDWIRGYHNGLRTVAGIAADYKAKGYIKLKFRGQAGLDSEGHGGINEHKHISGPGGHTDCGPDYPLRYVTYWARWVYHRRQGHNLRAKPYGAFVRAVQRRYGLKPELNWR